MDIAPSPAQVWRRTELVFTATAAVADPLTAVALTVTFTGPAGETYLVAGFYDGATTWRVRFTPTAPGRWHWHSSNRGTAAPELGEQTGALEAAPAGGPLALQQHGGFLRVSGNGRYLTYSDGTPFFWLGDTWWFCPSSLVPYDGSTHASSQSMFRTLIDTRRAQGFTTAHWAFLGDSGVNGTYTDLFRGVVNAAYWQEMDRYLDYANAAGILPVVGLGFHKGLDAPTLAQLTTLWGYFLARYGAHAITFLVCGEYNLGSDHSKPGAPPVTDADRARIAKLLALGQYIKDHDPYRRAMTIHPWWYGGDTRSAWGQPWYDFILFQGGHGQEGPPVSLYHETWQRTPPQPLLEGEVTYEGINGFGAGVVRRNAYKAIQCGSFGFTYGAHGLWYPTQDEQDQKFAEWGKPIPWWTALAFPGAAQLTHLRAAYELLPWWELAPVPASAGALAAGGMAAADTANILLKASATRAVWVLYFPTGQAAGTSLVLQVPAGGHYRVTLADPRTGAMTTQPACTALGGRLALPTVPAGDDWLLLGQRVTG